MTRKPNDGVVFTHSPTKLDFLADLLRELNEGHRDNRQAYRTLAKYLLLPSITDFKTTVIQAHLNDHISFTERKYLLCVPLPPLRTSNPNLNHSFRSDLLFSFGSCPVATLPTNGVFSLSGTDSVAPVMAYLDLEFVRSCRNESIKVSRCNRPNPPITHLRQKIRRRLNATMEAEDPYIAAVLVALAQAAVRDSSVLAALQDEEVAPGATTTVCG